MKYTRLASLRITAAVERERISRLRTTIVEVHSFGGENEHGRLELRLKKVASSSWRLWLENRVIRRRLNLYLCVDFCIRSSTSCNILY